MKSSSDNRSLTDTVMKKEITRHYNHTLLAKEQCSSDQQSEGRKQLLKPAHEFDINGWTGIQGAGTWPVRASS